MNTVILKAKSGRINLINLDRVNAIVFDNDEFTVDYGGDDYQTFRNQEQDFSNIKEVAKAYDIAISIISK